MKIKGLSSGPEREGEIRLPSPPLHAVLIIDCSESVKEHLKAVKQAAFSLADPLRERGKVGVVSYSGEGVRILCKLTDSPIRPGEELLLQFLPSDPSLSRPIRVMGEVVRVVELGPQEEEKRAWLIGLGIQFKNIHSQSRSDFVQYIKKLIA